MIDFMGGLPYISPWSSWCLDVFECESRDSVCFLFGEWVEGGRVVGDFLLTDSASAWKSEPEVMQRKFLVLRSLDADCPLPTYISSGSCTKSSDAFDCVQA